MRDLHNNVKVTPVIHPVAIVNANGVTTSDTIDTQGFQSIEFAIHMGASDGTLTPAVYAGDASDMSDEAAVTDASELLGTIAGATFAATDDNKVKKIGYRGSKRYVRIKITQAASTTGTFFSAVAIQGHPVSAPVA